ncbi:MAG: VWA domain-containing protein [Myxococcales bacterium]|jgi:Ca-activated chloride channel family protein
MLAGGNGATHIGVWVDVPSDVAAAGARPAMALSLVIDASGSMAGAKMRHARIAASRLVEALADGDVVSIIAFDDRVTTVAPPTRIDAAGRRELLRRISQVRDGGSTALHAGIEAGQRALDQTSVSLHPVRRVIAISDGLANVGPSHPSQFAKLAERGAARGIQVSAIGVGLDYSEQTLGALAMHSEGRMYHLSDPAQLAAIVDSELDLLGQTAALDAVVEITPAPGVVLERLEVGRAEHVGRSLRVPLGVLYAGQQRELLVRARVETAEGARRALCEVELRFDAPDRDRTERQQVALDYALSDDPGAVEASYDARVESLLASHRSAEQQRIAAELLNRGQTREAAAALQIAEDELDVAVRKAPASKKGKLRRARGQLTERKARAASASTPREAREQALESYDAMMGLQGF